MYTTSDISGIYFISALKVWTELSERRPMWGLVDKST